jgi:hypothetical protein
MVAWIGYLSWARRKTKKKAGLEVRQARKEKGSEEVLVIWKNKRRILLNHVRGRN